MVSFQLYNFRKYSAWLTERMAANMIKNMKKIDPEAYSRYDYIDSHFVFDIIVVSVW